mmetsp:Transcript_16611/g.38985  ORF Transcript_16611/g.38985 Transcript_16611/m.38985 type:complete len:270 (+) Transcript_16611:38-847(+)|eukprot:CAMPEP_0171107038 /NCGR_PEP_ID=MMETSP0766_2-20121228/66026_1 /TAXON_ID=439317 /ORGANISM="Gambierdiscus australes, Strain CAWD 149" /LENGTH=269 /DNA_ID=CAMNT_0011568259 /DNA_START=38 /DNA_END=847 /DNA_ORIENTATION=+
MEAGEALYDALARLDDQSATHVISEALRKRPELAPGVVSSAVPDLTYAPVDALERRRSTGVVKSFSQQGFGFISCPELKAVFGHDVYVHRRQIGIFGPGAEVNFAVLLSKDMKPQAFDVRSNGSTFSTMQQLVGMAAMGNAFSSYAGSWGKGTLQKGSAASAWNGAGDGWSGDWGDGPAKRQKTLSADAKPDVQQVLGQFLGTIKSFHAKNGFGFIQCEALQQQGYQNDVYLHHNQIGEFQPGHLVMFTAYLNRKGQPQAMDLQQPGQG